MQNILVTGGNGQVGSELQVVANNQSTYQFFFTDSADLDITNPTAVLTYFQKNQIHTCINCAAYTAVDTAESSPEIARKVNVEGAENLAKACVENGAKLIHLSTDYVYHNQQNTPFKEGDETNPQGVYAQTKLDGDLIATKICPNTLIMRTSWVYSSFGNNFVKTMLRLGKERDSLNVVFDQIGTPTYAKDIAEAAFEIIQSIDNQKVKNDAWQGVFHYSNEGVTSWYDFAEAIFDIENIECNLGAIESVQYPTPAKRPPFSVLNKGKIKTVFRLNIPHWRKSLGDCLEKLK
ncbi:MAG: dTDP-4-dehydrorhamnose reductase [Paraglaciecola sp.]|jgi:dTDP-4-dehydrorhamnose reductase